MRWCRRPGNQSFPPRKAAIFHAARRMTTARQVSRLTRARTSVFCVIAMQAVVSNRYAKPSACGRQTSSPVRCRRRHTCLMPRKTRSCVDRPSPTLTARPFPVWTRPGNPSSRIWGPRRGDGITVMPTGVTSGRSSASTGHVRRSDPCREPMAAGSWAACPNPGPFFTCRN